jgi:hypothetical protein
MPRDRRPDTEHADEVTSSQRWRRELSQLKDECEAVPER